MSDLSGHSYSGTEIPDYVIVGKYCSIGKRVIFHEPHANHLCIQNRKCVYTTNWDTPVSDLRNITLGNDVWIGNDVILLPGITIGNGVILGAGAVVAKDIPAYAVVIGNPARITRYRFTKEQVKKLQMIKWWDWPNDIIMNRKEDLKDIDIFLEKYE